MARWGAWSALKQLIHLHPVELNMNRAKLVAAWRQTHDETRDFLGENLQNAQADVTSSHATIAQVVHPFSSAVIIAENEHERRIAFVISTPIAAGPEHPVTRLAVGELHSVGRLVLLKLGGQKLARLQIQLCDNRREHTSNLDECARLEAWVVTKQVSIPAAMNCAVAASAKVQFLESNRAGAAESFQRGNKAFREFVPPHVVRMLLGLRVVKSNVMNDVLDEIDGSLTAFKLFIFLSTGSGTGSECSSLGGERGEVLGGECSALGGACG